MFGRKKKTLDSVTKNGIEAWLRLTTQRFADDPSLKAKFENALSEFQKGNYKETILRMERVHLGYEMLEKERSLSHEQLAEDCMLKVLLDDLKKLQ